MARLLRAALLLCMGLTTASCGAMVADHLPVWAGGEPAGLPPRPGTPGYEEYREKSRHPQPVAPDKAEDKAQAQDSQAQAQPAPSSNGQQKN